MRRRNRPPRVVVNLVAVLGMTLLVGTAWAAYIPTPKTSTWSPMDGPVHAIERIGNTVYIGGGFTMLRSPDGSQTVQRHRLAAFDAVTGTLLPWNPGANNRVRALQQSSDGSGLFVGGYFTNIAGISRRGIAEVSTLTGRLVLGFNPKVKGDVYAIERIGTKVFFGGDFTTLNGQAQLRVAAVDEASGGAVNNWNGSADGTVKSLLASANGSRLFVGGEFRSLSGQSRDFIGALNTGDGSAHGWRPPSPCTDLQNPCYALDLARDNYKVYAAVAGPGGRVVAYDLISGNPHWTAHGDGNVQAVAIKGGTVYAGGHFGPNFGNQTRTGFVALSAITGGVLNFAPRFFGGELVWEIAAEADTLRVGGGYTRIGSDGARQRYAEFPAIAAVNDLAPPTVPKNLRATNVSDTLATFYWDASSDDTGVSGYRLFRDGVLVVTTGVTNYTHRDLAPSTTYAYRVQAIDVAGKLSALSAAVTVTTQPRSISLHVGSYWKYLSNGGDQGTAWRGPNFNDSNWSTGLAQLGYGESDESTVISPKGVTSYFRKQFDVRSSVLSSITALKLRLLRDDGAVVYLNGIEVCRSNMPFTAINYQTLAPHDVSGAQEQAFIEQSVPVGLLNKGINTLAVEVHQHNRKKPMDLSFDLELVPTF